MSHQDEETKKSCLQLTAPPRDARRITREARKAAPDTAGRCNQPSEGFFSPFELLAQL